MRTLDAEFTAYEEYMNARIAKEETKDIYGDPLHYLRPRNVPAVPGALPGNPLRYAHWLQRGVIDPASRPLPGPEGQVSNRVRYCSLCVFRCVLHR